MVWSRCGRRLPLQPLISRSTSDSVRYSRVRTSAFLGRVGVPVSVSVVLGGRDQLLDLGLGQVFAGAIVGVGASLRANCLFYGRWGNQLEVCFSHKISPCWLSYCP